MSFLDDIKEVKETEKAKRQVVIDEICEHFQKQFDDGSFEESLKEEIIQQIKANQNNMRLYVQFSYYPYKSKFSLYPCCESFDKGGLRYKDISLATIAYVVVSEVSGLLGEKLDSLGLGHTCEIEGSGYETEFVHTVWF